jgi:hypothetical protein
MLERLLDSRIGRQPSRRIFLDDIDRNASIADDVFELLKSTP